MNIRAGVVQALTDFAVYYTMTFQNLTKPAEWSTGVIGVARILSAGVHFLPKKLTSKNS